MLKITLIRSLIGRTKKQRDTVHSLGLKKINQTVSHADTPAIKGMVNRISHLVKVKSENRDEG